MVSFFDIDSMRREHCATSRVEGFDVNYNGTQGGTDMYAWESIETTLNYIELHLTETIEIEELANIANLSLFYYQRLFKRLVKKPVQEYIKLRRLSKVITELKNTEERILDIALKYGFSDHANFTRAFKKAYHITPDEYRKTKPMLNTFDKPELSSNYVIIDENVPLIVGDIVLEIQRKTLEAEEIYFGFEKEINIAAQLPLGENTGVDIPGQLWQEFREEKRNKDNIIFNGTELGVSHSADLDKGTFRYFVGDSSVSTNVCPNNMVCFELPAEEYIICKIEAESFEQLVTTALNQANKYLFETWLPNHKLVTKPLMIEKYYHTNTEFSQMEIWVAPLEM